MISEITRNVKINKISGEYGESMGKYGESIISGINKSDSDLLPFWAFPPPFSSRAETLESSSISVICNPEKKTFEIDHKQRQCQALVRGASHWGCWDAILLSFPKSFTKSRTIWALGVSILDPSMHKCNCHKFYDDYHTAIEQQSYKAHPIPCMFSSAVVSLVSWSATVPSKSEINFFFFSFQIVFLTFIFNIIFNRISTSSSATELLSPLPPFSSKTVTLRSKARVTACRPVMSMHLQTKTFHFHGVFGESWPN